MAKKTGLRARNSSVKAAMTAATDTDTPTPKGKKVGLAIRLDPDKHKELVQLTTDIYMKTGQRRSIHSLLLEGLDMAMAKYK